MDKLSDIYNRQTPIFNSKVSSFCEAYPTIETLNLEVKEDSGGLGRAYPPIQLTERKFDPIVNCHNSLCNRGGINIGRIIHNKAFNKNTQFEETYYCEGQENTRSCTHRFVVTATVTYKPSESDSFETS